MYLTVNQVADKLRVSRRTIARRIADGSIKAVKLGDRTIRIETTELDRYIAELKTEGDGDDE